MSASASSSSKPADYDSSSSSSSDEDEEDLIQIRVLVDKLLVKQTVLQAAQRAAKRAAKREATDARKKRKRDEIEPGNTSLHDVVFRASRDWLVSNKGKKHKDEIKQMASDIAAAADSAASPAKEKKNSGPMAIFVVLSSDTISSVSYLVPLRLLPPIAQINKDIEQRSSANHRLYCKGKEVARADLTTEMMDEDTGDILDGCIIPLSVRTFDYSEANSVKCHFPCEFFAYIQEKF